MFGNRLKVCMYFQQVIKIIVLIVLGGVCWEVASCVISC